MSFVTQRAPSICSDYDDYPPPAYSSAPVDGDVSLDYPQFRIVAEEAAPGLQSWKVTTQHHLPLYQVSFAERSTSLIMDLNTLALGSIHQVSSFNRIHQIDLPLDPRNPTHSLVTVKIQLPTLLRSRCRVSIHFPDLEPVHYHWAFRSIAKWNLIQKNDPYHWLATYQDSTCGKRTGKVLFHKCLPPMHAHLLAVSIAFI
ncbi:hypothetical protein L0F63_006428, partial [Massospora cicadina]